jgi:hypothetical protein
VDGLLRDLEPFLIALFFAIRGLPFGTCGGLFPLWLSLGFSGFGWVSGCNILEWSLCYLDWLHFWIWGFSRYFSERFLEFAGVFWVWVYGGVMG